MPKVAMAAKGWSHSRVCLILSLSLEVRGEGCAEEHPGEEGTKGPGEVQTWWEKPATLKPKFSDPKCPHLLLLVNNHLLL